MTIATDATLAQLSLAADSDTLAGLPPGFTPLSAQDIPITLGAGESFAGGVYHNQNAAAVVTEAVLDGKTSLVVAFRGSDDSLDSQSDLNNINRDFPLFAPLLQAVDTAAASGHYQQVVVTGHSLGGAFAQLYMQAHPDQPGGLTYDAVTFGSPGAILPPGGDARPTNYVIADDPAVFLGAHRAEIGAVLRADDHLAELAAQRAAEEFPGLTKDQALASLGALTVNYENRGDIILLPTKAGQLAPDADVAALAQLDPARHAPELYVQELAHAAAGGAQIFIPTAPQGNEGLAFLRDVYDSDPPGGGDAGLRVLEQVLNGWAHDLGGDAQAGLNDAFTSVRDELAHLGNDLNLI
jgi:pimeloyl-ACP methyl ester carboxylesterase